MLKSYPFLSTPADGYEGAFSPDGRWVAYVSNETGSYEIYVRPFPPSNRGKWLVSKGGALLEGWRQDGKELVYLTSDGSLMSVPVTTSPAFEAREPELLFKPPSNAIVIGQTPDFKMFLVAVPIQQAASTPEPYTVVLNWTSLPKK